jgi:transposase-like protein
MRLSSAGSTTTCTEPNAKGMPNGLKADRGKAVVMGMLEREARRVRAKVIPDVTRETLQNEILNQIERKSTVYTDRHPDTTGVKTQDFVHETVNHVQEYVRGEVHTQGIENFWSLLKRGLKGTYVAVEPFHLDRYVDEQVFRYNNRATKDNPLNDADRFMLAVSQIAGKRLTYSRTDRQGGRNGGRSNQPAWMMRQQRRGSGSLRLPLFCFSMRRFAVPPWTPS